jgi:hypothetical protein
MKSTENKDSVRTFITKCNEEKSNFNRSICRRALCFYELTDVQLHYWASSDSQIFNVQIVLLVNDFNIGFRYPITDNCSTFTSLKTEIGFERNHKIKTEVIYQFRMHGSVQILFRNSLEWGLTIPLFPVLGTVASQFSNRNEHYSC